MTATAKKIGIALLGCVWGMLVAGGFAILAIYSNTPGELGRPPLLSQSLLPASGLPDVEAPHVHRLIMAVHPKCPCTLASLGELERLIAKCRDQLTCTLLIYHPEQAAEDWHQTYLADKATSLPNTKIVLDEQGKIASSMGMKTSGTIVLYNAKGEPQYWGGITPARGHEGDNLGSYAVIDFIRQGKAANQSCSAYGCPIEQPTSQKAALESPAGRISTDVGS